MFVFLKIIVAKSSDQCTDNFLMGKVYTKRNEPGKCWKLGQLSVDHEGEIAYVKNNVILVSVLFLETASKPNYLCPCLHYQLYINFDI